MVTLLVIFAVRPTFEVGAMVVTRQLEERGYGKRTWAAIIARASSPRCCAWWGDGRAHVSARGGSGERDASKTKKTQDSVVTRVVQGICMGTMGVGMHHSRGVRYSR